MNIINYNTALFIILIISILTLIILFYLKLLRNFKVKVAINTLEIKIRAWSNKSLSILILFIILFYIILSGISYFFHDSTSHLVKIISTCIFYILIGLIIYKLKKHNEANKVLGLQKEGIQYVKWVIPIYISLLPIFIIIIIVNSIILTDIFNIEIERQEITNFMHDIKNPVHIFYIIIAIFLAPFFEEVLFRGILLPKIFQKTNFTLSIILTSIIFAILHFHISAILPLFTLSLFLSLLYFWNGSLWACIAFHMLFNACSIVLLILNS